MLSIALSEASNESYEMKPNPFEIPESSRAIYQVSTIHSRVGEGGVKYLRSRNQTSKCAEGIIQRLLIHHTVQVTHKQLRADLHCFLLIRRRLNQSAPPERQPNNTHTLLTRIGFP